jgi:hypothetical protein
MDDVPAPNRKSKNFLALRCVHHGVKSPSILMSSRLINPEHPRLRGSKCSERRVRAASRLAAGSVLLFKDTET